MNPERRKALEARREALRAKREARAGLDRVLRFWHRAVYGPEARRVIAEEEAILRAFGR